MVDEGPCTPTMTLVGTERLSELSEQRVILISSPLLLCCWLWWIGWRGESCRRPLLVFGRFPQSGCGWPIPRRR